MTLEELLEDRCRTESDINEHLPTLMKYAAKCQHVTEFGVRTGNSTVGLLAGKPKRLISYDIEMFPGAELLKEVADGTDFTFHQANDLEIEIEPTDLLFIDTDHKYEQLKAELALHAGRVRKYLIFHDTSEYEGQLIPAIMEFLDVHKNWKVEERFYNNNGLMILKNSDNV